MIDELKLRKHITDALDGIQVTPAYFCHLVDDVVEVLKENYELIDLKDLQMTKQIDIKFEKKAGISHTHIWDNETPNRLYTHSQLSF